MPVRWIKQLPDDEEVYGLLRPYVASWFRKKYGNFTLPQRGTIPLVKEGKNVLVSSPTGSGKTLAVFLGIIDTLYEMAERGELEEQIYVVYISPLRALNNDMRRNLLEPLKEIEDMAGGDLPRIKVAVRTSDTPPSEKQKMARKPPHILLTTPESLAIALAAPKFRERLKTVRWVVIDEIHEIASSKRGSDLMVSVERLDRMAGYRLTRIGMSATISPLEEVAAFLSGYRDDGAVRDVYVVDARFAKPIDIRVLSPVRDLVHTPTDTVNESIYRALAQLVRSHRTTLVFTNTRSATERVVYKLRRILKEEGIADIDEIETHHSSLSRHIRLDVEEKLKQGKLRVVVSSTSLELGIDIGYIDIVVLLSSPKSVSRLLQRIGRAGHHIRQVSKGRIIVVDRDDLLECTVLAQAAREKKIDRVRIPKNPLDVLAQQLIGMSIEDRWRVDEAYRLIRRTYPFHSLPYESFLRVLEYLSGAYADEVERFNVYRKLWYDPEEGVFGRKRGSRMIYYQNSGTIPDESHVKVFTTDGRYVGNLEEAFVQILVPGDIFVLGGRTFEFIRSEGMKAYVKPAEGRRPTVPSWFSEMLPLSYDSALEVGKFRRWVSKLVEKVDREKAIQLIMKKYAVDRNAAESIYGYVWEQYMYTDGKVPGNDLVLVEVFRDEEIGYNIVFHTLYGRRANNALSRAYAFALAEELGVPVRVTVSDNGFMLSLPNGMEFPPEKIVAMVGPGNMIPLLRRALARTEFMKRIFRHVAQRSFMILKRYKGREKSPHRMQVNAETILKNISHLEGFPVLEETYREIMEDKMDVHAAIEVLEGIRAGRINVVYHDSGDTPSPFAHHLAVQGYSDVVLMEDRRRLLQALHRMVLEKISSRATTPASGDAGHASSRVSPI
ncbi:MAG: ATP-dependent helicase [Desulfurococcales archaeon]|nr:ATP-dependent helicase [Desulfurococcales archaeon]